MTDFQALQALFWFGVGFIGTGFSQWMADRMVARYHRVQRQVGQNLSTKATEKT